MAAASSDECSGHMKSVEEFSPDSSDWDYKANLYTIDAWLTKTSNGKDRERVRNLITACVRVIDNAELQSSVEQRIQKQEGQAVTENITDCETGLNPLAINMVFQEILRSLPLASLLTCRLVNRTWNSEAVGIIRSNEISSVTVRPDPEDFKCLKSNFRKTTLLPFTKLEVTLDSMDLKDCSRFFKRHGTYITGLKVFEIDKRHSGNTLSAQENILKLKSIISHIPNVKELSLNFISLPLGAYQFNFDFDPSELENIDLTQVKELELFSHSQLSKPFVDGLLTLQPNLKSLHLQLMHPAQDYEVFLDHLKNLSLNDFEIWSNALSILRTIASTHNLKKLSIPLQIENNDGNIFEIVRGQEELLKSQSNCMKELLISNSAGIYSYNEDWPKLKLPVMTNLRSLTLEDEDSDDTNFAILPIEPDQVPKLKAFNFCTRSIEIGAIANSVFTTVLEIGLVDNANYDSKNCKILPKLSVMFPNLRKLSGLSCSGKFKHIGSAGLYLENIEHLELGIITNGSDHDTSGSRIMFNLADRLGPEAVFPFMESPLTSLSNIKRLTTLKLHFVGYSKPFLIDDIWVYCVFLRLSPKLALTLKGNLSIPDDLAGKLEDHFQTSILLTK